MGRLRAGRHRLAFRRACLPDNLYKSNGLTQDAALTQPRQGFLMPDGRNGAECGEKLGGFSEIVAERRPDSVPSNGRQGAIRNQLLLDVGK
jgi:hypothetical protein